MSRCARNPTKEGMKRGHAWVRNGEGRVACEKCGRAQRDNGLDVAQFTSGAYKLRWKGKKKKREVGA